MDIKSFKIIILAIILLLIITAWLENNVNTENENQLQDAVDKLNAENEKTNNVISNEEEIDLDDSYNEYLAAEEKKEITQEEFNKCETQLKEEKPRYFDSGFYENLVSKRMSNLRKKEIQFPKNQIEDINARIDALEKMNQTQIYEIGARLKTPVLQRVEESLSRRSRSSTKTYTGVSLYFHDSNKEEKIIYIIEKEQLESAILRCYLRGTIKNDTGNSSQYKVNKALDDKS